MKGQNTLQVESPVAGMVQKTGTASTGKSASGLNSVRVPGKGRIGLLASVRKETKPRKEKGPFRVFQVICEQAAELRIGCDVDAKVVNTGKYRKTGKVVRITKKVRGEDGKEIKVSEPCSWVVGTLRYVPDVGHEVHVLGEDWRPLADFKAHRAYVCQNTECMRVDECRLYNNNERNKDGSYKVIARCNSCGEFCTERTWYFTYQESRILMGGRSYNGKPMRPPSDRQKARHAMVVRQAQDRRDAEALLASGPEAPAFPETEGVPFLISENVTVKAGNNRAPLTGMAKVRAVFGATGAMLGSREKAALKANREAYAQYESQEYAWQDGVRSYRDGIESYKKAQAKFLKRTDVMAAMEYLATGNKSAGFGAVPNAPEFTGQARRRDKHVERKATRRPRSFTAHKPLCPCDVCVKANQQAGPAKKGKKAVYEIVSPGNRKAAKRAGKTARKMGRDSKNEPGANDRKAGRKAGGRRGQSIYGPQFEKAARACEAFLGESAFKTDCSAAKDAKSPDQSALYAVGVEKYLGFKKEAKADLAKKLDGDFAAAKKVFGVEGLSDEDARRWISTVNRIARKHDATSGVFLPQSIFSAA